MRGYTPSKAAAEMKMGTGTLAAILAGEDVSIGTVEKVAAFIAQHPIRRELVALLEEDAAPSATAEAV